jgi:thiosulfate/3-mercaptopyruvate sulfurtransferase
MVTSPLVSVDWLREHLNDPQVAIADCRFSLADPQLGQQQYLAGHLPGAYYFDLNQDLSSPVRQRGGRHPLPDIDQLSSKLATMGLDSTTSPLKQVVAYDESRFGFAARFWWLLRYLGYDAVFVLDGGLQAWQQAGYPMTTVIPEAQMGYFVPQVRSNWVVNQEIVKARKDLPNVVLVDSREAVRYRGEYEPIDPIAGHISGAVNYPWQDVTDQEGKARSPLEQQQRWSQLPAEADVIVYCGSGVTACVNLLSLELAGRWGKLYAGSWSDWCS